MVIASAPDGSDEGAYRAPKPVQASSATICEATSAQGALMAVQIAELVNRQESEPLNDTDSERLLTSQRLMRDIQGNFTELSCEGRVPLHSVITPAMTLQQAGPILASMSKTPAERAVLEGILKNGYMLKRKPVKWRNPKTADITVVEPTPATIEINDGNEEITIQYEQSRLPAGDGRVRLKKGEMGIFYSGVEISADRLAKETLLVKPNSGNRIVKTVDRRIVRKLLKRLDPEFNLNRAENRFLAPITRLLTTERYPLAWSPSQALSPGEVAELRTSVYPLTADQATREMAKFALGVSSELARMSEEEIKKMVSGEKIPGYSQMNADDLIRMRLINKLLDEKAQVVSSDDNYFNFILKEQAFDGQGQPIAGKFVDRKVRIPRSGAIVGAKAEVGRVLRSGRGPGLQKVRFGQTRVKADLTKVASDIIELVTPKFIPDPIPVGLIKEDDKWKQVPITPAEQAECMQILAFGQSNGIGIERTLRFYGDDPTFGGTTEGLVRGIKCNKNTRDSFAAALKLVKFPKDLLSDGAVLPSSDIALALLANDQRLTRELVLGNMRFACIRKTPLPTLNTLVYDYDMAEKWVNVPDKVIVGDLSDIKWNDGQEKPSGRLFNVVLSDLMGETAYARARDGEGPGRWQIQQTMNPGAAYELPKELLLHKARMMAKAGILAPTAQWLQWGSFSEEMQNLTSARREYTEAEEALKGMKEQAQAAEDTRKSLPRDSAAIPMADILIERFETDIGEATDRVNAGKEQVDKWSAGMDMLRKVKSQEAYQQWQDLTDYITDLRKVWPNEVVITGKEAEPVSVRGLFGQFQAVYDVTRVSPELVRGLPKEGIFDYDRLCGSGLAESLKMGKDAIEDLTAAIQNKVEGQTLQDAVIELVGPVDGVVEEVVVEEDDELLKAMRAVIIPKAPAGSLIGNPVGCLSAITEYLAKRPIIGRLMGLESHPDFMGVEAPEEEKERLGDPERELELMISLLDAQCGANMIQWAREGTDSTEKSAKQQLVKNRAAIDLSILKSQSLLDDLARLTNAFGGGKVTTQKQRERIEKRISSIYQIEALQATEPELIPYIGVVL